MKATKAVEKTQVAKPNTKAKPKRAVKVIYVKAITAKAKKQSGFRGSPQGDSF